MKNHITLRTHLFTFLLAAILVLPAGLIANPGQTTPDSTEATVSDLRKMAKTQQDRLDSMAQKIATLEAELEKREMDTVAQEVVTVTPDTEKSTDGNWFLDRIGLFISLLILLILGTIILITAPRKKPREDLM